MGLFKLQNQVNIYSCSPLPNNPPPPSPPNKRQVIYQQTLFQFKKNVIRETFCQSNHNYRTCLLENVWLKLWCKSCQNIKLLHFNIVSGNTNLGYRAPRGPNGFEITREQVETLQSMDFTVKDMTEVFKVHATTVKRRLT